ncbi:TIGR03086 family metal-binding protein [Streptomyces aidingensis]|uniref:TIGR03086 family protein n=1 Tax=Streptomyces aidingensis TaxID=910347 RepID=A0A1I1PGB2_9ACTN|nr:TIGR03086 family metal-binding protein [Streptomyces aidingensis]SFD06688.1 TIGR03086 family protein [Streptomyces aidingensis]
MELVDAFDTAYDEFDRRVHRIGDGQWQDGTPCTEWSVRDLVNHLVGEHLWAPLLLRGATLAEVGDRFDGDVLGDDPVAAWERAGAESRRAFHRPGALDGEVETSGGPTPATEYAQQMISDLAIHSWDLARGIGADERLDPELVGHVGGYLAPRVGSWRSAGVFGAEVPAEPGADAQTRLLAATGRAV